MHLEKKSKSGDYLTAEKINVLKNFKEIYRYILDSNYTKFK